MITHNPYACALLVFLFLGLAVVFILAVTKGIKRADSFIIANGDVALRGKFIWEARWNGNRYEPTLSKTGRDDVNPNRCYIDFQDCANECTRLNFLS